jgi:hypothetical protein
MTVPNDRQDDRADERGDQSGETEQAFRAALLRTSQGRNDPNEVQSAAARLCRELRDQGFAPQDALKVAKRVIRDAIDGEYLKVAEAAVESCIKHYYRAD